MMKFYIAKTPMANGSVRGASWIPVDSATLDAAKEEAEKLLPGEEESVWVGRLGSLNVLAVAVKDGPNEWYGFFEDVPL